MRTVKTSMVRSKKNVISRKSPLMVAVANSLRHLRMHHSLSQEQLGVKAGIARSFISGIEGCKRNITIQTLDRILSFLDDSYQNFMIKMNQELKGDSKFDSAPECASILDRKGSIMYAAETFCEALGYGMQELAQKSLDDLLISDAPDHHPEQFKAALDSGSFFRGKLVCRHRQGHPVNWETTLIPLNNPEQKETIFVAVHIQVQH